MWEIRNDMGDGSFTCKKIVPKCNEVLSAEPIQVGKYFHTLSVQQKYDKIKHFTANGNAHNVKFLSTHSVSFHETSEQ
jgi:hypothetical protein